MRIDDLERELRGERPELDPEFARRLDEWADDGFPRDRGLGPRAVEPDRPGGGPGPFERLAERLRTTPPRRILAPVGSLALMVAVVGVGIAISQGGGSDGDVGGAASQLEDSSGDSAGSAPAPAAGAPEAASSAEADGGRTSGDSAELAPSSGSAADLYQLAPAQAEGVAGIRQGEIVDAAAQLRLGAERGEVQEVANGVVEVTDRFDGVVLDSRVSSDRAGATASFRLEIPYRELGAALRELSGLADVISRSEQGENITGQAVRVRRDLADVFADIEQARIERIEADTREQRLIIDARIDSLEATAEALSSQIDDVKRRGRFATVRVEVTSNGPAKGDDAGGGWSLADALDDAGRVLEVMGGIALISLAVLAPLALLGLLAWLVVARARQHSREQVLND